jgi:hypothetical protein
MDSLRPESNARPRPPSPCRPEDDLEALARWSERNLPRIDASMRTVAERQVASSKEKLMSAWVQRAAGRPWLAPMIAGVVAAILLFVPSSYDRITAYDVKLVLHASQLDGDQAQKIATELRKAVHATGVQITPANDRFELTASVPAAQAASVSSVARAFAAALEARHFDAEASVAPVKTNVHGNVYAMALSRVINVNIERAGRSDAEIAADIKRQIQAAGFDVTDVEYRTDGSKLTFKITKENNDPNAPLQCEAQCPDINLTIDGQSAPPSTRQLRIKIGKEPGDTDESIRQRVLDQIHAQGMDANVVVQNGKIVSIDPIQR